MHIRIPLAKTYRNSARKSGFTLMELMIVLAIIGLLASLAMPSVSSIFNLSLKSTARKMAGLVKEAYNQTLVTGRIQRIVYDFEKNQYWVERGSSDALIDTSESKKIDSERNRTYLEARQERGSFAREGRLSRTNASLDRGVKFVGVYTSQDDKEPIKEGKAYTHFFPTGETERTIIHIQDLDEHKMTLLIEPLSGKSQVHQGHLTPEDLKLVPATK